MKEKVRQREGGSERVREREREKGRERERERERGKIGVIVFVEEK